MTGFDTQLDRGFRRCGLDGKHVLVAVSGGADSVSLLCGLRDLSQDSGMQLTIAHLDHALRDISADDAKWVGQLAEQCEVPFVSERCVLRTSESAGVEEWARDTRYEFLIRSAERFNCDAVAVAHTADDQAETILHHILRGTGLPGLAGMPSSRQLTDSIVLVRPMLDITRESVLGYLQSIGQDFRTDESNRDTAFTRNRIRLELLPQLRETFNRNVAEALCGLGQQAQEVTAWLDDIAAERLDHALVDHAAGTCRLNCRELTELPAVVLRHLFVCLWKKLDWPRKRMRATDWARLADLVIDGSAENLPGNIDARRRGELLVLRRKTADA